MVRKEEIISAYAIRNNVPVSRVRCCFRSINLTNSGLWQGEVGVMWYDRPVGGGSFTVFDLNPTKDLAYIIDIWCNKTEQQLLFESRRHSGVGSLVNWKNFFTSRLFITENQALHNFVAIINYYHLSVMPELS